MDKATFESMIDLAIQREIEAFSFYSGVAQALQDKDKGLAMIFGELAVEEKSHRHLLETFKQNSNSHFKINAPSTDYHLAEVTKLPELSLEMKPAEAFALAMKKEQQAAEFYQALAAQSTDTEISEMCLNLANMELQHKKRIENAYIDIAYPEAF